MAGNVERGPYGTQFDVNSCADNLLILIYGPFKYRVSQMTLCVVPKHPVFLPMERQYTWRMPLANIDGGCTLSEL